MNKHLKNILTFAGAATIGASGYTVVNQHNNETMDSVQSQPEVSITKKKIESLDTIINNVPIMKEGNAEINSKTHSSDDSHFVARPVKAGQASQLIVMGDWGRKKDSVEKIVLLENGIKISEVDGPYLNHEVLQQSQGTHEYQAQLHTKSGQKIETGNIEITFTGTPIDFIPYIESFHSATTNAAKATKILVEGKDIGDNKGIKRITLYEDGKPLVSKKNDALLQSIQYDSPQTHTYHAQIEDNGGQVITTDTISVAYSGEALPPLVSWFGANPKKAGRTTRIFVEGEDSKNYDDLKGIDRIILYENGKKIHEKNDEELYFEITHNKEGNREYQAEIYNLNGKVTKTEPLTISFMGKDFPPDIDWWHIKYKSENGFARAFVEGKDKKNIRDDAGISQIVLYENGNPIKTVQNKRLITDIEKKSGTYTYFAEITNNSGLKRRTDKVNITYPVK